MGECAGHALLALAAVVTYHFLWERAEIGLSRTIAPQPPPLTLFLLATLAPFVTRSLKYTLCKQFLDESPVFFFLSRRI
jgi:hypothetical protein